MDESNVNIDDQSIGSMIGVLEELQQEILRELHLEELYKEVTDFRRVNLKPHEIQYYQFNFDNVSGIRSTIDTKFTLAKQIISHQAIINQQFLIDYHRYEKSMITDIRTLNKQDQNHIKFITLQVVDWHSQLTNKFNLLTQQRIFCESGRETHYNAEIYQKLYNEFISKDISGKGIIELQKNFIFSDVISFESISKNIEIAKQFLITQVQLDKMVDFLNGKMIWDISQVVKNSIINIDKIMAYLSHLEMRALEREWQNCNVQLQKDRVHIQCINSIEQLRLIKLPQNSQEQETVFQQFDTLHKQLNKLIGESSDPTPRAIKVIVKYIFTILFKGRRKAIKLKGLYSQIAQVFGDTLDKEDLLSQQSQSSQIKLNHKDQRLTQFITGFSSFIEYCPQLYILDETLYDLNLKIQILIRHYTELLILMGNKSLMNQNKQKKRIFEPFPNNEKSLILKKYQLNQTQQSIS